MDHRATIHEGKLLPTWIYLTTLRASLPRRRLARWVLTSLVGPGGATGHARPHVVCFRPIRSDGRTHQPHPGSVVS